MQLKMQMPLLPVFFQWSSGNLMGKNPCACPSHKTSIQLKNLILDVWRAGNNNLNNELEVSLWVRRGNKQVLPFFPVSQGKAPEGGFAAGLAQYVSAGWGARPTPLSLSVSSPAPPLHLWNVCAIVQGAQWICRLRTNPEKIFYMKAGSKGRNSPFY